jgi:hypothetical protein
MKHHDGQTEAFIPYADEVDIILSVYSLPEAAQGVDEVAVAVPSEVGKAEDALSATILGIHMDGAPDFIWVLPPSFRMGLTFGMAKSRLAADGKYAVERRCHKVTPCQYEPHLDARPARKQYPGLSERHTLFCHTGGDEG